MDAPGCGPANDSVSAPLSKHPLVVEYKKVERWGGNFPTTFMGGDAGAKTVLVEQFGYLGGTATASLMACINGFRNQVEPDAIQVVRGIAEEIVLELQRLGGLGKSPYEQKDYPTEPVDVRLP